MSRTRPTAFENWPFSPSSSPSPEREVPPDNPLTTKEGWRTFVGHAPQPPQLTRAELLALPRARRNTEQDRRRDYHADLPLVNTPTIQKVISTGRLLVQLNRRQISARRGAIICGMSGTGKTTALTQLGQTARAAPSATGTPAAGPTSRSSTSPSRRRRPRRMMAMEFARFLGLPLRPRANITDVTDAVCGVCLRHPRRPGPASILPTVVTAVLDVRPACVPGRSVIIYRLGPDRPSCSQASVRRACGSAGCDRSAQGSEADEEGRPSVVDDRVAGGDGARRGGPVPAPS